MGLVILDGMVSLSFLFFSLVQANDEDYFIWIPVYLIPAIFNTVFIFVPPPTVTNSNYSRFAKIVLFVHSQFCIVMSIYLVWNKNWWSEEGEEERRQQPVEWIDLMVDPAYEVERELGGLWICLLWTHNYWPATASDGAGRSKRRNQFKIFKRNKSSGKDEAVSAKTGKLDEATLKGGERTGLSRR